MVVWVYGRWWFVASAERWRNKRGRAAQYAMDGRTDAGRSLRVLVTWAMRQVGCCVGDRVGSRRQVTSCHG